LEISQAQFSPLTKNEKLGKKSRCVGREKTLARNRQRPRSTPKFSEGSGIGRAYGAEKLPGRNGIKKKNGNEFSDPLGKRRTKLSPNLEKSNPVAVTRDGHNRRKRHLKGRDPQKPRMLSITKEYFQGWKEEGQAAGVPENTKKPAFSFRTGGRRPLQIWAMNGLRTTRPTGGPCQQADRKC